MSDEPTELTGPDFNAGVPIGQLTENAPLLGHADGEPAILVRTGGEVFAVGAKCTHYGGPLAEGLVADGTIRCPWHHAAFDLRTGRMSRPPALHDLPCWTVEQRDGKAFVTRRADAIDAESHRDGQPSSVVIIGAGPAGTVAALTLRREGYRGRVRIIDAGDTPPTDRPNLSKDYLAGNAPEEWMPLFPDSFYADQEIELSLGTRVTSIDTKHMRLTLDDGSDESFGALLIATGADPIRLDMPGAGQSIHYLRTLADSRAIIARANDAKKAVVIGASFIGLEVAASLRTRGLDVTVIAPEEIPLERVLGRDLGLHVRSIHDDHGVQFRLGQTVTAVSESDVTTSGGERIPADLVVAGVGVRPNISLAESAGLATDRGVLVNEFLETSVPGIYAAGDIAKWPDANTGQPVRVEHWVVAERQGQCAARNIMHGQAGPRERFDAVPFFWSNHYDVAIGYVGHAEKWDTTDVEGEIASNDAAVKFRSGDRVLATATIFRDRESLESELAMERRLGGKIASG
jgi:NADPH-dependent 2,4-dienoyl-CoA reductase/sulfur reductase-like enzyme/nitrite reductase/ring-hydroxylating ferredoxin subunit